MKRTWINGTAILLACLMTVVACRKNEAPLPDNTVKFESAEQGAPETSASITVKLVLDRAVTVESPVTVQLTPSAGLEYGVDYTTTPAANAGSLTVPIPSGAREASFTVTKTAGALFYGDETIGFKITAAGGGLIIASTNTEHKLSFAEIIATNATIVGQGGGATYGNKVFFDLSANSQTAVQRTKWDLGFNTTEEWRVILNSSTAMMAKQIDKNDLNTVTAADTVGFSGTVIFNQSAPSAASLAYIDYPDGSLAKTAIAEVSATAGDNKVYIVNRGTGIGSPAPARGWKKIRILRNGSGGYTLQHADIAATSFNSIDIPKDAAYFFKYVSFETGAVEVEPQRNKWDLAWTFFSNLTNFGGAEVPYTFQDIVIQNRNVQIAKVLTSTKAYADFGEADLAGVTWNPSQTAIGADWRAGGGPSSPPAVHTDRFYILRDGDNNYYKVKFTGLTQNGERGFPAFEYSLIKKG